MATLFQISAFLALLVLAQADNPSGFMNIDCGIPENSSYIDAKTGLKYVSDAEFIDTGEIKNISSEFKNKTVENQFRNLRSFPDGIRNCYTIRAPSGGRNRYLIRVSFMHGNYDNEAPPTFDLFLGVDYWDSVVLRNASTRVTKELIHVPPLDYMQICLIDIGKGVPFISAIEIRTLDNNTYVTKSGSLMLHKRLDYGLAINRITRYPNDIYDRIWSPSTATRSQNITSSNRSIQSNAFAVPSIVMGTAVTPKDLNQSLNFTWNTGNEIYIYMHFTDLHKMGKGEFRAMNIFIHGSYWYGPLVPEYLSDVTLYSTGIINAPNGGKLDISIQRNDSSSLPPLINAIEIYVLKQFPQFQTNQAEIEALLNIKSSYQLTKNWQGDPCYPPNYSWAGLNCSYNSSSQTKIISLNLSLNGLAGEISSHVSNLTMIQYLDLSNNHLNGTVPEFLATLPFLRVLNLENNNLSGIVPPALIERTKNKTLSLSVEGNPNLCLSEPCNEEKNKKYVVPLAASLGGVTLALLIGGAIFWSQKRQKKREKQISGSSNQDKTLLMPVHTKFSYSEILSITNNFERVIGKGGFGTVYHGCLHSSQVSVKMLSPASVQCYKHFQEEAQLLTKVHHGNLTSVLGYCDEDSHQGLVYEHMDNGNLADHLSEKSNLILNWKERLRIALDAAQGLEYLHFGCKPPIIHRDLKSTNILLDRNFHAKLADFGFSKAFHLGDGAQASSAVGTPGYLDPEYSVTNKLSEKSDVYSFGVILLEIITGQPAITKSQDKTHVIKWVISGLKEEGINKIVDSKLEWSFKNSSILKFIELAMNCVASSSTQRPSMTQVVMELKQCLDVLENPQENNDELSSSLDWVSLCSLISDSKERQ